jgi:hypothetical protein
MTRHLRLAPSAAWVAVILLAVPVCAEPHRDTGGHYSLELPADWGLIAPAALAQMNAFAAQRAPIAPVRYDKGFQVRSLASLSYPYILVQMEPLKPDGMTYEEIEQYCAKMGNVAVSKVETFSDLAKDINVGAVALDRSKNRIVFRTSTGPVEGLSVGMIGAQGIVFLHCYAPKSSFAEWTPTFNKIVESFQFEPRHTFVPRSGWSFLNGVGGGALRGAILGAVGGLVVGLVANRVITQNGACSTNGANAAGIMPHLAVGYP